MSTEPRSQTLDLFLVARHPGVGDGLAGALCMADDRIEVGGDPFELRVDDADELRGSAELDTREMLDCLAERHCVGDRVRPLDPLGQQHGIVDGQVGETAIKSAMLLVHPGAEVRDFLAGGLDQILDALKNPRANGSVRDGEDAFAAHMSG
jgi:hypothetical protein